MVETVSDLPRNDSTASRADPASESASASGDSDQRADASAPAQPVGIALPKLSDLPGSYEDTQVPRLPRGRGIRLSFPEILRILMVAVLLIAVITLREPCADSVGVFIEAFEPPAQVGGPAAPGSTPASGAAEPTPAAAGDTDEFPADEYIHLPTDLSEAELRERLEALQADKAAADSGEADTDEPGGDEAGGDRADDEASGDESAAGAAPGSSPGE